MKKIFISYARIDKDMARRVFERLQKTEGIEPWFDEESLLPGAKWRPEIRKAIRESDFFLALVSSNSNQSRGVRHSELDQALDILKEFPINARYLIPVRLNDCQMPRDELDEISWVDVFPNFDAGIHRLIRGISGTTVEKETSSSDSNISKTKKQAFKYHYRVAIIDIDEGIGGIDALAVQLNSIQNMFYFVSPSLSVPKGAVTNIGGIDNFATYLLPNTLYKKHGMLNVDLAVMATNYPLAFKEGDNILYNYFSGKSDVDERFMFISLDQLYVFSKEAGCTFEQAIINIIAGQLLDYFTNIGFHDETRGCPMDFCEIRHDIVKSLKKQMFCKKCLRQMKNSELTSSLQKMLAWIP
ncbi:MAG: toll/interleukin-1 receptor domain-containing protein [Candidatus Brocadiaceae bacterium]|nr:toll/interleukin-1 receptor domain-containing protein [Candidatus Brocadiaceae bacterium]